MLDRRGNALALKPLNEANSELPGQHRVFRIAFEVPAIGDRALNVDRRRQRNMRAFGLDLLRQRRADFLG